MPGLDISHMKWCASTTVRCISVMYSCLPMYIFVVAMLTILPQKQMDFKSMVIPQGTFIPNVIWMLLNPI